MRKYAFHIILAGYRFSKAGQKKHASRAYRQGFQLYKGHGWGLAEDHILYSLGHQSLLLKEHYSATSSSLPPARPGISCRTRPTDRQGLLRPQP